MSTKGGKRLSLSKAHRNILSSLGLPVDQHNEEETRKLLVRFGINSKSEKS